MYDQLYSWDNLYLAYRRAAMGKRGRISAAAFEYRLEDNLCNLLADLCSKSYRPGGYCSFYIHEPKRRLISAAPFRDRVVHHALCNIIEPIFERSFIFDSYANRVGKGTHRALDRCQGFARRYRYALQCDVAQFFPAIDHAILRGILARKVDDIDTLWLIDQIIASGIGVLGNQYEMQWFAGDGPTAAQRPRGLPIGNLTSQFWANCYMNGFDHFVKRQLRCLAYIRYVDDFVLFSDDKGELREWHNAIVERLAELRLTIHPGAHPRPVTEGLPFLGFVVYPDHRRLKRRKGIFFQRKLRRMLRQYAVGEVPLEEINIAVQGWLNHVRYANTIGLQRAVLSEPIPRPQS